MSEDVRSEATPVEPVAPPLSPIRDRLLTQLIGLLAGAATKAPSNGVATPKATTRKGGDA